MEHIVLNLLNQKKDLSLSLKEPDYSEYQIYGISDWAEKKVNSVRTGIKILPVGNIKCMNMKEKYFVLFMKLI